MFVKQIEIESLSNSSYLVGSEETKECLVIDPARDVEMYLREAESQGFRIVYAAETHVHNDFVSGSRELAALTGATVCSPGAGGLIFDHRPLRAGDTIRMGEVTLEVIATPGHTPEHISYLATDGSRSEPGPHTLFSGGALLVGGVARSDLLGPDIAPFLGRWFHRTITTQLQKLEDSVVVYPTHGGGSFCLATPSGSSGTTTTIGQERATNAFFQASTEDEFLDLATSSLTSFPSYYSRMAAINVRGPRILGGLPKLYPLAPREVWVRSQSDSVVIDARRVESYAELHVPSAYSILVGGSFGTWAGWLIDEGSPVIIVSEDEADKEEMVRHLIRIGYDVLDGYLEGGMEAWQATRLPTATTSTVTPDTLYPTIEGGRQILPIDVRFDYEWRDGHVPGAINIELGDLPGQVDAMDRQAEYAMVCAVGVRSSTAASVMERAGFEHLTLVQGGTDAWRHAGLPIETG